MRMRAGEVCVRDETNRMRFYAVVNIQFSISYKSAGSCDYIFSQLFDLNILATYYQSKKHHRCGLLSRSNPNLTTDMSRFSNLAKFEFGSHSHNRLLECFKLSSSSGFETNHCVDGSFTTSTSSLNLGFNFEQPQQQQRHYAAENGSALKYTVGDHVMPAASPMNLSNNNGNYHFNFSPSTPLSNFNEQYQHLKLANYGNFSPDNNLRSFGHSNGAFASSNRIGLAHALSVDVAPPFSEFDSSSENLDLKNIWKMSDDVSSEITSRFRGFSISSESVSENLNELKCRPIMGRGASYYERFGTKCIVIPKGIPIDYPVINRKLDPFGHKSRCGSGNNNNHNANNKARKFKNGKMECAFCKNIDENSELCKTHWLKNNQNVITCPVLRAYTCPYCKNPGGDMAHTLRYCPLKRQKVAEEYELSKANSFKAYWLQPMQQQQQQQQQQKKKSGNASKIAFQSMMLNPYSSTIANYDAIMQS